MKRPPTLTPLVISNSSSSETRSFLQGGDRGDDLEGRAGRLGGRERLAGERAHVAVAGVEHGDAAGAPGQGGDRGFLQVGVDRRLHRRARPRFGLGDGAAELPVSSTASSLPPGLPARRVLKARSRPLIPTGVSAAKPWRASFATWLSVASPTSPVTSIAALPSGCSRSLGRAFGQRRAVGGEDRRPRRQFDLAFQVLAFAQAREDEAGVPGDAAFGVGQLELVFEAAEGDGGDGDRHRDDGLAVALGGRRGRSRARARCSVAICSASR